MTRARLSVASALLVLLSSVTPVVAQVGPMPNTPRVGAAELDEPGDDPVAGSAWRGALADSMRLLLIEHGVRVAFQEKTRVELGGPFFRDYQRSVRMPRTWGDGDHWLINYVGHPIHGAAAGHIWRDHEPGTDGLDRGWSRDYWAKQGRAVAWATGYSLQFEFGPFSEASIGNVGLRPNTTGWVDHVVTPAGAFGFLVAEDALDRYLVRRFEERVRNRVWRASMRMLLNPSRTLSNAAQGRTPWHRTTRTLSH
ncbi:MAG TPA: hypothetical protein VMF13_11295 [Luteitalea sp.]|nr:hypothetical protein [Luteitalea sp.]